MRPRIGLSGVELLTCRHAGLSTMRETSQRGSAAGPFEGCRHRQVLIEAARQDAHESVAGAGRIDSLNRFCPNGFLTPVGMKCEGSARARCDDTDAVGPRQIRS